VASLCFAVPSLAAQGPRPHLLTMSNSSASRPVLNGLPVRAAQRERRLEIFLAWNRNPNFTAVGREFGLTRMRVHQIVWKAIVWDGCRSDQARDWMARLDPDGYWLRRYEAHFKKPGRRS